MGLINRFKNNNLHKIVNVYQPKYKNLVAQGFGDYLRGCVCLLQFCRKYNLEFDMDISNHPMSKFLLNNSNKYNNINRNQIEWFSNPNYVPISNSLFRKDNIIFHNQLIKKINNVNSSDYYMFCNSFPMYNKIGYRGKEFIRNKIKPNEEMINYINKVMLNMKLIRKQYTVIHIRSGDDYLLKNQTPNKGYLNKIINICKNNINPNNKYLILSDNNNIKHAFHKFPNCIFYIKDITHLGEHSDKSNEKIKNTLLDFYLMSQSNKIISLSPDNWGSGFSQWCSVIYNVSYKKIIM